MLPRILSLLSRLPADRASVDWSVVAVVLLGGAALFLGWVTPEQLPSTVDAAVALLAAAGLRGAVLSARARTSGPAAAALVASAAADVRAGKPVALELVAAAEALVDAMEATPTGAAPALTGPSGIVR